MNRSMTRKGKGYGSSMTSQNKVQFNPFRRSAMHQKHLELGASMVDRDGWQQPSMFVSVEADCNRLQETVGIIDISRQTKFSIKGAQLDQFIPRVFSGSSIAGIGESNMEDFIDEKVTLCRLVGDEILCVAPATLATRLAEALSHDFGQCAHALELTSGLAGIGIAGPEATRLLSMISELNTSVSAFSNLRCAQSKFADIHGVILRNDIGSLLGYQLYFGREFGEYLWEAILEAAGVCGGGPVGFEALDAIAGQDASAA